MPGSGTVSSTGETLVDDHDTASSVLRGGRETASDSDSTKEDQHETHHCHNRKGGPCDLDRRTHRVAEALGFTSA